MPAPPKPVSSRGQGAFVDAVVQEEFDHQRSQRRKGAGKRLAVVVVVVGLFASLMGGAWYAGAYFRSAPGAAVAASEPAAQVGSVSSDGKPVAGSRRSSTHLAPADQTSFNCTIDSEPRGAEVLVDGQPASGVDSKFTPMNIWLEPDKKHTIQIKKDGYEVSSLSKRVESGKVGNINARLTQTLAQAQSGKPKAGKPPVSLPSGGVPSVRGTEPQVQSPVEASPPQPSAPVAAPSASPLGTTTPKPTAQSESPKAPNRDDTEAGKPMPTATAGQDSLPGASDIKWPENLGKSKIPGL